MANYKITGDSFTPAVLIDPGTKLPYAAGAALPTSAIIAGSDDGGTTSRIIKTNAAGELIINTGTETTVAAQGDILSAEHTAVLAQNTPSGTLITVGAGGAKHIGWTNNSGAVIEINVGADVLRAAPGSDSGISALIAAGTVITITPRNVSLTTDDTIIINVTNT